MILYWYNFCVFLCVFYWPKVRTWPKMRDMKCPKAWHANMYMSIWDTYDILKRFLPFGGCCSRRHMAVNWHDFYGNSSEIEQHFYLRRGPLTSLGGALAHAAIYTVTDIGWVNQYTTLLPVLLIIYWSIVPGIIVRTYYCYFVIQRYIFKCLLCPRKWYFCCMIYDMWHLHSPPPPRPNCSHCVGPLSRSTSIRVRGWGKGAESTVLFMVSL